jgi:membrane protease YdiL (CAAX protease family)
MFQQLRARLGAQEAAPPWSLTGGLVAAVAAFLATIIGGTIAYSVVPQAGYAPLLAWTIGGILTIAFVFISRAKAEERAALRTASFNAPVLFLLFLGVGIALTLDVLTMRLAGRFLPEPELLNLFAARPIEPFGWLMAALFLVVIQPIAEELVFRGLLLPALRAELGPWPGYLLDAAIYALFHLLVYPPLSQDAGGLWIGLGVPFVAGLVFAAVRLYTGSTRAAMVAHAAFGLFALAKLFTLG